MSGDLRVRAGDIEVACRIEGPEGAPVVMLAHGMLTSLGMWDAVARALAPRWRVLRYDLRGHGGSTVTPAPYTMQQLAADAVALLDALDIPRVHFVGSSLGGMIAQRIGADAGDRIGTLTLSNTTAVQGAPQVWEERIATARGKGVAPLVEPTLQRWFTEAFLAADPEPVQRMRALALATPPEGFAGGGAAVRDLAQADLLARIAVPTLVIAGEQDRATPPADSEFLQRGIPGARLVRLRAAHQSAVECPEAFVHAWESFVAAPAGGGRA